MTTNYLMVPTNQVLYKSYSIDVETPDITVELFYYNGVNRDTFGDIQILDNTGTELYKRIFGSSLEGYPINNVHTVYKCPKNSGLNYTVGERITVRILGNLYDTYEPRITRIVVDQSHRGSTL